MIADVQVVDDQLVELAPLLERSGVRVHVDHCGRPDPGAGLGAAGFRELLRWGASGRAVVKLSGCVKVSQEPYPHRDLLPYVRALVDAFGPDRCVWGSDWPFLRMPERVDYGPLLDLARRAGAGRRRPPPHPLGHPGARVRARRGVSAGGGGSARARAGCGRPGERTVGDGKPDQYAAPTRAEDLTGLPPAFIDVGTVDLFRDEDIAFAQRLMQAGIPTELHVHDGAYHAAERFAPEAALSLRIWAARLDALRRALA